MVPEDKDHRRATQAFRTLPARTHLITTNYILSETATWLVYHNRRQAAFRFKSMVAASTQQNLLSVEWITPLQHEDAWSILERYQDKEFSFCDCASFVVCAARDVDFVFGFDSDFRTAGFDLRPGGD
jgi:predicted nucleic acid-binding protein